MTIGDAANAELPAVAHINETNQRLARLLGARHQDAPAACNTHGPIRKPIGWIAGSDDQARAQHGAAFAKCLERFFLARGLEWSVRFVAELLFFRCFDRAHRCALVGIRSGHGGVHGYGGYKHVVACGLGEQCGGRTHVLRSIAGCINHAIPAAPVGDGLLEGLQTFALGRVAVALDLLKIGEQISARLAAVEQGELPTAALCSFDYFWTKECRSAEDKKFHGTDRIGAPGGSSPKVCWVYWLKNHFRMFVSRHIRRAPIF